MRKLQDRASFGLGILGAAALLTGLLTGCSSEPTIKIVSSLPRTGSARVQTDTIVNGVKLAIEEAGGTVTLKDASGKDVEYKLQYLDWDDATAAAGAWTAEAETANAQRAAADPDVMVYIGPFNSGAAKNSMPILNKAGLLMISPSTTWPGLTKPGLGDVGEPEIYQPTGKKNFTRVVPADDLQGVLAADWCRDMGIKSVYILDDKEVYGRGIALLFEERCKQIGIEVLGHDSIDVKASEFKSLMTTVKAANPDLVYFGGTTQSKGGQVAKDLAASGSTAKLMVPDGCMEAAFIEAAGVDNVNGRCYVTFGGLPPSELKGAGAEFVKKYQAKFGRMPEPYAVYGYEATKVAIAAIRSAGVKDRAKIIDAVFALRDMEGSLGKWNFDENGDTTLRVLSGSIVTDGDFKFERFLGEGDAAPAETPPADTPPADTPPADAPPADAPPAEPATPE